VNGTEMTGSFKTSSKIEFGTAPHNILFYIPEPYAVDANRQKITCQYEVKNQSGQIWFYIRIPYTWLSASERAFPITVDPSVVGTSTTYTATYFPYQRKSFYANGRFWVFYLNGTNMVFRSSTDGTTWSSETVIRPASGIDFDVFLQDTYVHYAFMDVNTYKLYYRRGTLNSDGTITWTNEQYVSDAGTVAYPPAIGVDSNGYPWIGYVCQFGYDYYPYVIKSSRNDGIWQTASGFPYQLSTTSAYWRAVSITPLTAGKMLAIYTSDGVTIKARRWDGSAWGAEVATTSAIHMSEYYSAVAQGDNVHLVFLKSSGYDILYVKYTYSTNSFGTETTLQAGATAYSAPVLSIDPSTNDLYVFAATKTTGTPSGWTANHIYYIKYTASTGQWGSWTDWIDETTEELCYAYVLTCFYNAYGNYIGLVYVTKTASPYNVKFAFLSVIVAVAETIVAKNFPMDYLPSPAKAAQLTSKVSGATITKNTQDYPLTLLKKDKAQELKSKWT
jgi:hypothetical protein